MMHHDYLRLTLLLYERRFVVDHAKTNALARQVESTAV